MSKTPTTRKKTGGARRPSQRAPRTAPVSRNGRRPARADAAPASARRREFRYLTVEEAAKRLKAGGMLIVVDDADRENEGDLVFAAEKATPALVNFAVKYGRGILCAPMAPEIADRLGLELMVPHNTAKFGTPFTESVDARRGTTTGTSAFDRARTFRVLADPATRAADLVRPGHVFPLRAVPGGVLRRAGHTEAVPDLCRLAGLKPVGAVCEILSEDGRMARLPELQRFALEHGLGVLTVRSLIEHRRRREVLVRRVVSVPLPTPEGAFQLHLYEDRITGDHHLALVRGNLRGKGPVLVRVHSQCLTGDVFHSRRCDCGEQLAAALRAIERRGRGVLLYLRQEGRGIGLKAKLEAYALQDSGLDTVEANVKLGYPADLRDYGIGAQILVDLGVRRMAVMTNNPRKLVGLEAHGLEIVERVPIRVRPTRHNRRYLATKRDKLGHLLDLELGGDVSPREIDPALEAGDARFCVVAARFNAVYVDRLVEAAVSVLRGQGVADDAIDVIRVPGSFELPLVCRRAAESGDYDAVLAFGVLIEGETEHFRLVAESATDGIASVAIASGVPVLNGILAVRDAAQAAARTGGAVGNRGAEVALAALQMAGLMRRLGEPSAREAPR